METRADASDAKTRLAELEAVFAALAHAARRQVLLVVWFRGGTMSAGDIAGRFSHTWPTTSRHLRVLEDAGLLAHERQGRTRIYRVDQRKLDVVRAWLRWFDTTPRTEEDTMPKISNIQRNGAALRDIAMSYPGAHEDFPWGETAVKVKGKAFLFMHMGEELSLSCKLPASHEMALMLPFAKPTGYGLGKSGWVSARFGPDQDPPLDLLREWIDESYRAIAPKKLAAALAGEQSEQAEASAGKAKTASKPGHASKASAKTASGSETSTKAASKTGRASKASAKTASSTAGASKAKTASKTGAKTASKTGAKTASKTSSGSQASAKTASSTAGASKAKTASKTGRASKTGSASKGGAKAASKATTKTASKTATGRARDTKKAAAKASPAARRR